MAERRAIPRKTRFEIFERDNFTCQYCGAKAPHAQLQIDHIFPVSKGGGNEKSNLVTACVECNGGKGANPIEDKTLTLMDLYKLQGAVLSSIDDVLDEELDSRMFVHFRHLVDKYGQEEVLSAVSCFADLNGDEIETLVADMLFTVTDLLLRGEVYC